MIEIKQNTLSFFTVFILSCAFFAFLIAIVTVDRNSAALIGKSGLFSASSPLMQGARDFLGGVRRFFSALDSPCLALMRSVATGICREFLTLFSLPELIRSFFVELFHTI